jgi:hypothetical protein
LLAAFPAAFEHPLLCRRFEKRRDLKADHRLLPGGAPLTPAALPT